MKFRKEIEIPQSSLKISHQTKLLLLGSCFAENIGHQLSEFKFQVDINPFGVLYNPLSIAQSIELIIDKKEFTETDIFEYQESYHTFFHHSQFSSNDKNTLLEKVNYRLNLASKSIDEIDTLMLTFGTSYVFKKKTDGSIVSNCHKLPSSMFDRSRLNIQDIVDKWSILITKLRNRNPSLKILFTVSPIRHWADGAHNNQLSKATLLLAIDELTTKYSDIFYFPSYEILLDELRDYRFYDEDMLHPNNIAIKYIWEIFSETFFSKETSDINSKWINIVKAMNHRPFNTETHQHKQFLRQTLLKIKDLRNKYSYFECEKEEQKLADLLSTTNTANKIK